MTKLIENQHDRFDILESGNSFNINLNTLKKPRSSYVLLRIEIIKTLRR